MNRTLTLLGIVVTTDMIGFGIVIPLLPFYSEALGATPFELALVVASFPAVQLVAYPIAGRLSDWFGRKRLIAINLAVSAASYVMLGFADTLAVLLLSRITAGLGGTTYTVAQAYVADSTDESLRTSSMSRLGAGYGIGLILGPAIGGYASLYGFGFAGFIAAAISLVSLTLALMLLPEVQRPQGINRAAQPPITKLLATLVALRSLERGRFDLDDTVAAHWPEFAAEGKERITIRQVLSHRAGIPDGPALPLTDLQDRNKVRKAIEAMPVVWEPGTANGYHAHTIGWVLQELVSRWEGKPLEVLLREEILAPLGIQDIHLGLAEKDYPRMAKMTVGAEVRAVQARRSAMSDFINSYDGMRLPMASVMGAASAIDLARLMAALAGGGESNGQRIVSVQSLALASIPTNAQGYIDLRLNHPIRWGLDFILGTTPDIYGSGDRPHLIGHAGGGANVAWADSKTGLGVAFLCNRMLEREQSWIRYRHIGDAIYAALT